MRGLSRDSSREQEMSDEIESHIQMQAEENQRAGMSAEEARRRAILKIGGVERTRQAYRERDTLPLIENLLQDLRFAFRQLVKNPGLALTAILILTLGIAASAALFAFVDAALLKPLPYAQPNRLAAVYESGAAFAHSNLSHPDYLDWKRMNKSFQSLDAWSGTGYALRTHDGVEPVAAIRVTDGFFRTLGVVPILGRDFFAGEDLPSGPRTTMISYTTWQHRFGGRRDIIGQPVSLSDVPYTVVGVLPKGFNFAPRGTPEFWTPFHAESECDLRRSCHGMYGVGRLKDGVSLAQAQQDLEGIAAQLAKVYPENRGQGAAILPLSEAVVGTVRPILLVLLAGAGLLLLIACVNVSSLLLVRAESRRREMAVRGALGASPMRLVRQFLTEGVALVAIGSVLGLGVSLGVMQVLLRSIPKQGMEQMPYLEGLGLNLHLVLFTLAIAAVATVLFALTPVVRLPTRELQDGLNEGGRGAAGTLWRKLGSNLVVAELAIAMILLAGAGLLGKSLYRLLRVELGFAPDHLATLEVSGSRAVYKKDEDLRRLDRQLFDRLNAVPGVQSAALTSDEPVGYNGDTDWLRFEGHPYNGEHNESLERDVSPSYFQTIQAKLLQGRDFTPDDDATHPKVAIINEALAQKYFHGEDPVGKRVGNGDLTPDSMKTIVGVVDNFREGPLDEEIWPAIYYPMFQSPDNFVGAIVRTKGSEAAMLPALAAAVRGIDHDLGVTDETTMNLRIQESQSAYMHRSAAWMVGSFAALAALLGVVGLYGVVAYSVGQRTREIGVRMALGAQRGTIYGLVLKEAARLTALGVAAGLLCSVAVLTLMGKLLFQVKAWDLPTLVGVSLLLGLAALVASYLPAHRAASVNPVEALRAE
ncbi:MAG TPA: ABC transporter permease [Acidobacteriaceae bacterium]|jgi:predicted permease